MDQTVTMTVEEWRLVINAIASQPWHLANPLLMKMGGQLQQSSQINPVKPNGPDSYTPGTGAQKPS